MALFELALLAGPFAVFVTAHVALVYGLLNKKPRWRGLAAILVWPVAPVWGLQTGMRFRSAIWIAALLVYAVMRMAFG